LFPAADLVRFAGAELQEVLRALGLPDQMHSVVIVLHDGPVGVVFADRGVDLKPAGQFGERVGLLDKIIEMISGRLDSLGREHLLNGRHKPDLDLVFT
jgi:hypothetical protein